MDAQEIINSVGGNLGVGRFFNSLPSTFEGLGTAKIETATWIMEYAPEVAQLSKRMDAKDRVAIIRARAIRDQVRATDRKIKSAISASLRAEISARNKEKRAELRREKAFSNVSDETLHERVSIEVGKSFAREGLDFDTSDFEEHMGHVFAPLKGDGPSIAKDPVAMEGLAKGILSYMGVETDKLTPANLQSFIFGRLKSVLSSPPTELKRSIAPWSINLKVSVYLSLNIRCAICHQSMIGDSVSAGQLEHRITSSSLLSRKISGGNTFYNLYPAHAHCNVKRSDKPFAAWTKMIIKDPDDRMLDSAKLFTANLSEDLGELTEYAFYEADRRPEFSTEGRALDAAIKYIAENYRIGNPVGDNAGRWYPISALLAAGVAGKVTFIGSDIEQREHEEVVKAFGKTQSSTSSMDVNIGDRLSSGGSFANTKEIEEQIKKVKAAFNSVNEVVIRAEIEEAGRRRLIRQTLKTKT